MAVPSLHTRPLLVGQWLVLTLLLFTAVAQANMGRESSAGQLVAEPVGIKDIAIVRETLAIDLRPLAANGFAMIEVVYQLHNHGPAKRLDLLFASGEWGITDFRVWLGDQPVHTTRAEGNTLPTTWQAPKETPGIHNERGLQYLEFEGTPMAFTVVVSPGPQVLTVRYSARAAVHVDRSPTVYHQFAYVLAPARDWSDFGGLDVAIQLPESWRAACTPSLAREGDILKGRFETLPADAIAVTVQAPEGRAFYPMVYASEAFFGLAMLGGAFLCWRAGRSKGRSLARPAKALPSTMKQRAWPNSLGVAALYDLAVVVAGMVALLTPFWVLPAGQEGRNYETNPLGVIALPFFLSVLAVPSGFLIAQSTAVIVRYRAAAKARRESTPTASLE
jgi:hypothetical protein